LDEEKSGGVDINMLGRNFWEILSDGVKNFSEEDHGRENVGFVDEGNFLIRTIASDCLVESVAADAFTSDAGEVEGVGCGGTVFGLDRAARGEEAFGVLADDGEVDLISAVAFEGRVVLGVEFDGARAGVEVQPFAEINLGCHFTSIGPANGG
jgi:hypothetical protein